MDNPAPQGLRTDISVDTQARTVTIEFYKDEQHHVKLTFTKSDTHTLIEGLQKAVNAIGNRKKAKGK